MNAQRDQRKGAQQGGRGAHAKGSGQVKPLALRLDAQVAADFLESDLYLPPPISNRPAHHGPAIREYLTMPDLRLRLVALPGYSP